MGAKGAKSNSQAAEFKDDIVETLQPVGDVTSKSMFGGFGIFEGGDMFAIVDSSARLYFKADNATRSRYESRGSEQHKPMPYFEVPADVADSESSLVEWATEAALVAHASSKKKKK